MRERIIKKAEQEDWIRDGVIKMRAGRGNKGVSCGWLCQGGEGDVLEATHKQGHNAARRRKHTHTQLRQKRWPVASGKAN